MGKISKLADEPNRAVHLNESSDWYSPPEVSDGFEHVFERRPDFDPASCAVANKLIRAAAYLTALGLETAWPRTLADLAMMPGVNLAQIGHLSPLEPVKIIHNPPSPPEMWWRKLTGWAVDGCAGLFVAYSIEQLQQSQLWTPDRALMSYPHCIPKRRVRYWCRAFDARKKNERKIDKLEEPLADAADDLEKLIDSPAYQLALKHDDEGHGPLEPAEEELLERARALEAIADALARRLKPLYKVREQLEQLDDDELVEGEQPTHASAYVLLGANEAETQRFEDYFTRIGSVVVP